MKKSFTNALHRTADISKTVGKKIINYKGFGLSCSIVILLILFAVLPIGIPNFPSFYNFSNFSMMMSNNSVYGILAVGIMMVLLTGGIDISIGSTLAVSAVTTAQLSFIYPNVNPVVWVLLAIVIGAACGFVNGFLVGKLKVVPLIATLGTMYAYRGLAFLITGGKWYIDTKISDSFRAIAKSSFLGFDSIVWILVGVIILAAIFLALTKPGRRLYAVGTNEQSSIISGTNTGNVKIMAYTICGALAGLAGILYASNDALAHSEIGINYEMTAIAICVIGGVANTGGKGRVDCLALGILFMTFLSKLLASLGDMTNFEDVFKGGVIIVAVIINITNENIKSRREVLEMERRL